MTRQTATTAAAVRTPAQAEEVLERVARGDLRADDPRAWEAARVVASHWRVERHSWPDAYVGPAGAGVAAGWAEVAAAREVPEAEGLWHLELEAGGTGGWLVAGDGPWPAVPYAEAEEALAEEPELREVDVRLQCLATGRWRRATLVQGAALADPWARSEAEAGLAAALEDEIEAYLDGDQEVISVGGEAWVRADRWAAEILPASAIAGWARERAEAALEGGLRGELLEAWRSGGWEAVAEHLAREEHADGLDGLPWEPVAYHVPDGDHRLDQIYAALQEHDVDLHRYSCAHVAVADAVGADLDD